MKVLKWLLWAALALIIGVIGVVAFIALTIDPNAYKPEIVRMVKERTGRTLTLAGDIELKFFPKIGAAVQDVTLSVPHGEETFARIEEARAALALLPLLSKHFIVDEIALTGVQAELVKFEDGSTNFDDLLGETPAESDKPKKPASEPSAPGAAPVFDIGGISLQDATLGWEDRGTGMALRASEVNLNTGRIASGVPGSVRFSARVEGAQPALALRLSGEAGYRFELAQRSVQLSNLAFKAQGDAGALTALDAYIKGDTALFDPDAGRIELNGIEATAQSGSMLNASLSIPKLLLSSDRSESKPLAAELRYRTPARSVEARLALSALEAEGGQVRFSQADMDVSLRQEGYNLTAKVGSPLALNLDAQRLALSRIAGDMLVEAAQLPKGQATLHVEGEQQLDWGAETAQTALQWRLPDGTVETRVTLKGFDKPAIRFTVEADRLDLDQYRPPEQPAAVASGTPAGKADAPAAEETLIDLGWLKPLQVQGNIKAGALKVADINAEDVQISLAADQGRLTVNPMTAQLYQGRLQGSVLVDANSNRYELRQRLAGVSIGPLLRDVADKDLLEGRGNVELALQSSGTTPTALKQALGGTASVVLKDGAFKGINLAEALRRAKAMLGSQSAAEERARGGEQTDFTDMSASFRIREGIARNEDLLLRSPFLRVSGQGDVNIPAASLDYAVKASLVNTSTGQGGKSLDEVADITVPVTITGPLDDLRYRLDTRALLEDKAKETLRRELERRLGGKREDEAPQTEEEKPRGRIGERLLREFIR